MNRTSSALFTAFVLVMLSGCTPKVETPPTPPVSTPEVPPVTNNGLSDLIVLETPQPESTITSPLTIIGKARGMWYSEASFPIVLTDWDGLIIAEGTAMAQGEWMTEDFVPFQATLDFEESDMAVSKRGALILKRDNPSGLPENDQALEITIFFQ